MTFDLTDELLNAIMSALENQEQKFLVEAGAGTLINAVSADDDEENNYALPEWDSAAGFRLREDFVSQLHAPLARDELQNVLHSGRGVFRNFKSVLKEFPEVEKLWHQFRRRTMRSYIGGWYNNLREIWGLEKLDQTPEESDDLVHNDFIFQEYDPVKDRDIILNSAEALDPDCSWPQEIKDAVSVLWRHLFEYGDSVSQTGFVCRALAGDFAGCITAAPILSPAGKTAVLTSFFVPEAYRGLGIGSELFSMCLSDLQKRGRLYVLTANTIIPDSLIPILERTGFQKTGSGFAAKLL
ncbi:MAG: GNAT family N-acetyltransferase [Treponema sp.]|nr:GNAT family N-acetyltransferase [Treponema sp.]